MRASPMSGLLSAMMISSEGTQFSLDFLIIQIHHWHLHLAQCIAKPHLVPPRQFRRFAQRELADLEEPDCELKLQLLFDLAAWPAARHQQVIRILDCHFSHEITIPRVAVYLQACKRRCSLRKGVKPEVGPRSPAVLAVSREFVVFGPCCARCTQLQFQPPVCPLFGNAFVERSWTGVLMRVARFTRIRRRRGFDW